MYGRHPYQDLDTFELSDAPLTPDAEAVLGEIAVMILDIFERYPKREIAHDWSGIRQVPYLFMLPDQLIPSHERVKAPDSEIALQVHAKRARLDPKSMPRYRRQFKRRFSDV